MTGRGRLQRRRAALPNHVCPRRDPALCSSSEGRRAEVHEMALAVLRHQPALFGSVASTSTAWRTLEAVDEEALARIATARATARRRVWAAGAYPGFYVI